MERRLTTTVLLSGVLIGLFGFFNHASRLESEQRIPEGLRGVPERFWFLKTHISRKFDVMILGDSRVYRGVSPAAMQTVLREKHIHNFAYSSGGLNPGIYKEATSMLAPDAHERVMVIGVTPHAFLSSTAKNEHFLQYKNKPLDEIVLQLHFPGVMAFFEPITFRQLLSRGQDKAASPPSTGRESSEITRAYYQVPDDHGWVASWKIPENSREFLWSFKRIFSQESVSPFLVDALTGQTHLWVEEGILVVAFRLPTTNAMVEMENELSGFDEGQFVTEFEKAGGVWFTFHSDDFRSFDGSHLHRESAVKLSIELASRIKQVLETRDGVR